MASSVDISNLALGAIGDPATVSKIDPPEGSVHAEKCSKWYPIARDALLERFPWSFAKRRAALAEVLNPLNNWLYAYALPNDCVRPRAVLEETASDESAAQPFDVETDASGVKVLYTNVQNAQLLYTRRVTDATKFTPLFTLALVELLAAYLAGPVLKGTTGVKMREAKLRDFMAVYLDATASDAGARMSDARETHLPPWMANR